MDEKEAREVFLAFLQELEALLEVGSKAEALGVVCKAFRFYMDMLDWDEEVDLEDGVRALGVLLAGYADRG